LAAAGVRLQPRRDRTEPGCQRRVREKAVDRLEQLCGIVFVGV
jgi:hypothetical protein